MAATLCSAPHGSKASHLNYDRLVTEWLSSGRSSAFGTTEPAAATPKMGARIEKNRKNPANYAQCPLAHDFRRAKSSEETFSGAQFLRQKTCVTTVG
jgi:hypothetical protein